MEVINMDLNAMVNGVELTKVCALRADNESTDKKNVTLNIKFNGVRLSDVFEKAITNTVIQWQNANRKNFDSLKNGQVVVIDFKAPGKTAVDPKQALIASAKAAGVDVTNIKALMAYIESEIAKGL